MNLCSDAARDDAIVLIVSDVTDDASAHAAAFEQFSFLECATNDELAPQFSSILD